MKLQSGDKGIKIFPLILFGIIALPFVVIAELLKDRSPKR